MAAVPVYRLDFETTSAVDLRGAGAYRYAEDPSTRVLCWAVQEPGGAVWGSTPRYDAPPKPGGIPQLNQAWLRDAGEQPEWHRLACAGEARIAAFNAPFEFAILNHACTRLFGWPAVPVEAMTCSLAQARYWGFSGSLGVLTETLGLPHDKQKDKEGHALMMKLAKPRRAKKGSSGWWDIDDRTLVERELEYCVQDVVAEAALSDALHPLPEAELEVFHATLEMNARGVRIDRELAEYLRDATRDALDALNERVEEWTQGRVRSTAQVAALLAEIDHPHLDSLAKDKLEAFLARDDLTDYQRDLAGARLAAAKASTAKLSRMLEAVCADGYLRGLFEHYGAARTGRWAGRIVQPQNLPRGEFPKGTNAPAIATALSSGALELDDVTGALGVDKLTTVSGLLRSTFVPDTNAEQGGFFLAGDYAQIEARKVCWLAGQKDILDIFARGDDVYTYTANEMGSDSRQLGKVAVLGLGFQMGGPRFRDTAAGYGIELTEDEAIETVRAWRELNHHVVQLWYDLDRAVKELCQMSLGVARAQGWVPVGPQLHVARGKSPTGYGSAVYLRLPSRRPLVYPGMRYDDHEGTLEYWGTVPMTNRQGWVVTYGGKLVENATQASARDVMAAALVRLRRHPLFGSGTRLTVHDEAVSAQSDDWLGANHVPSRQAAADAMQREMEHPLEWATGLPIKAEVNLLDRYAK